MEKYLVLATFVGSIIALLFALITGKRVLSYEEGTPLMSKISRSIREGANAYLRRQYTVVGIFFACMVVVLCAMAGCKLLTWFVPFAFLTGGFFSGLSGFVGMRIATKANCRTANACRDGLNKGLRVAFSAGSVMGFTVVGLGLLDISVWFLLLRFVFKLEAADITSAMLTFGMGASSMALFARVGGGIFTKAADVGADLVGKVEAGIPEDDPRNPAVIADNVGDNVGDVAGMGADLYESYVGSIISASALGVASFSGQAFKAMAIPMVMAAVGILCSIIGSFFVKTDENADQRTLLKALSRGTNLAAILIAVISFFLVWALLGIEHWGLYVAILSGLVAGVLIGKATEYYTSDTYKPTQELSSKSQTGSATIIIGGLGLGMLSTAIPIIIVAVCILLAFFLVGLVYVCSTALTGWFPNIVAAAWYRAETRPLTMIPFGVLPLIVFAAVVLLRAGRLPNVTKIIAIVLLAALAISCQFGNTVRSALSDAVYANMTIDDARPDEQLTATKEKILKKVVKETGTDSVVVSDPLNGSMYATAMYGADMLFPIYNAKAEKNGAIFGQTENAFASGDGKALTNTVCPLSADGDAYFLSMGGQAPSLQMFTFKQQYDTFHDQKLIDQYAKDGTMRKVQDYSNMASYAKGWALYQFNCQ